MHSDSHTRNCVTELQQNLGANYEVSSFVKSDARMDTIVNTARDEIKDLRSEDVMVIWGGANYISRNNIKLAMKHVFRFVEKQKEVNIVIMNSPHRHDLVPSPCVNNKVLKFNRQVEKKMKNYNNIKMLETDLDRKYFTKHGEHLNSSGKELISMKLTIVIKEFFTMEQLSPICLQW